MFKVVYILCGLPGSGKSTYIEEFYPGAEIISQDELGSRTACMFEMQDALEHYDEVVIDRTNINKKQRKTWIDIAKNYEAMVVCVHLLESPDICLQRIHERKGHPTIKESMSIQKKQKIIEIFQAEYEEPAMDEGFDYIITVKSKHVK